jgi:hypothetical protein
MTRFLILTRMRGRGTISVKTERKEHKVQRENLRQRRKNKNADGRFGWVGRKWTLVDVVDAVD